MAVDQNGVVTRFDSLTLPANAFTVLEATEGELRMLEEAMKKIGPSAKAVRPKTTERFWKVDFQPPRLPRGSKKIGYVILYRDPFTGREAEAQTMRGGGKSFLYVKAPYIPSRLFIRFKLKGKEFRVQIPFKVRWVLEVS